jgi:hypothetical protein
VSALPQQLESEGRPQLVRSVRLPRTARIVKAVHSLVALLITWFPWLLAANRVQVDRSRKCPACGIRKFHAIVWSEAERVVMHTCAECQCRFGEKAIIADAQFLKAPVHHEPEHTL